MGLEKIVSAIRFPRKLGFPAIMHWMEYLNKRVPLTMAFVHHVRGYRLMNNRHATRSDIYGTIGGLHAVLDYVCYAKGDDRNHFEGCNFSNPAANTNLTRKDRALMREVYRASQRYFRCKSL